MKKGKYIDWNILKRSMDHELSEEEKNTFENWYASHESHRNYYERMISEWNRETLRERNLSRILSKYDSLLQTRERCHLQVIRRRILYWSVAAVLFIGFGVAWIIEGFQSKVISPIPFTAIVPGQSKAYLSLYDGTNICLDETMDSLNIKVGTTEIRNRQGTVTFVMNDELWNLMPMDSSLNSSKNNKLPKWEPFFEIFAGNQFIMYEKIYEKPELHKLFEACYRDNLHSIWAVRELYTAGKGKPEFCHILEKNMQPVYDSARRQGYEIWNRDKVQ